MRNTNRATANVDSDVSDEPEFTERPPTGLVETVLANCRPQPAIPAALAMLLLVLLPLMSGTATGGWAALLVAAGTILSCGLAVAAGFCSFFPPAAWLLLAGWAVSLPAFSALPAYNGALFLLGALCAVAMLGLQFWRVQNRKFVPTVREYPQ